jgi:diguanylate cyclase (GGDEF)-like protein
MTAFTDSSIGMDAPEKRLERCRALKAQIETCDDPRQKLEFARNLYAMAQNVPDTERGLAAFILGTNLNDNNQFEAALIALEEARNLQIGHANPLATTLDLIGYVKYSQGDYPQAMTVLLEALEQAQRGGSGTTEAMVLNTISMVYDGLSDINNSLEYQLRALEAYRRSGYRQGEATSLSNLAIDYSALGAYERGLEFSLAGLEISEELGMHSLQAAILGQMGTQYLKLRDDRATDVLKRACRLAHRTGHTRVIIESLHNLGRAFLFQERPDLARRALRWAITLAVRNQRPHIEVEASYRLARMLVETPAGQPEHGSDADAALALLQTCAQKVEHLGDTKLAAKIYRTLSSLLERNGQSELALTALKTSMEWNDRQRETETKQRTLALTMQHSFNEANLQAELERTQRLELVRVNKVLMLQTEQLERDATHDGLTGLPNRRYLERLLESECTQAATLEAPLCVALADIDYFKQVNDRFSHAIGDEVLRVIARIFRDNMRFEDTVGRYGGEEFAFILPDTDKVTALTVLERLRTAVEQFDWASVQATLSITVSIGIAEADQQQGRVALLNIADTNLYIAKRAGRNRTMS